MPASSQIKQFVKFSWVIFRESIVHRVEIRAPRVVVLAFTVLFLYWVSFDFYLASMCDA